MQDNRNSMLDSLKGLACILITFIHIPFPDRFGVAVDAIASSTVPLFMLISGYYAFACDEDTLKRRMVRIFRLTVLALVLYALFSLVFAVLSGTVSEFFNGIFNLKNLAAVLFLQDFDAVRAGHLWFLPGLALSYGALLILQKKGPGRPVFKLLLILILLMLTVSTVVRTLDESSHYRNNFLIYAMPYFLLGYHIADKRGKSEKNVSSGFLLLIAAIGEIVNIVYMVLDLKPNFYQFGLCVCCVFIFLYATANPGKTLGKRWEIIGRQYSLWYYIFHLAVAGVVQRLTAMFLGNTGLADWIAPVVTVPISLLVAKCCADINSGIKNRTASS